MRHPLDRDFATPRFHEIPKVDRAEAQRALGREDSRHCPLKIVTGYNVAILRNFVADPDMDQPDGDRVIVRAERQR